MTTINDILKQSDFAVLGHWNMWANDVQNRLAKLVIRKTHIPVEYIPVEYQTTNGHAWQCQHASITPEEVEHWDSYREVASGIPQPVTYQLVDVCDECNAWSIPGQGVWYE